jgi:hypothetical protein
MRRVLAFIALAASLAAAPAAAQYGPYDPEYPMGDQTSYTALWWVPEESGWGLNTNHQDNIVFATLFTYAPDGQPMWLVGPSLTGVTTERFSGPIYRTTGPAFNQVPWTTIGFTQVGTMQIEFMSSSRASVTYTFNGTSVSKTVQRQVFGAPVPDCVALAGPRTGVANYQDLWWNPAESGWGLNMVQQGTIIFTTLFTYSAAGRDMWLVGPALTRQTDGSYTGALYSTTGPRFDTRPWTAINVTQVGTMTLRFSAGDRATLTYTVNGTSVTKSIERQAFGAMAPVCS